MHTWESVEKMAYSLAWNYSKKTGVPVEDFVSACKIAFFERQGEYLQEEKVCKYLYMVFRGACLDEITKSKKFADRASHDVLEVSENTAHFPLMDFLQDADISAIVERVLNPEKLTIKPIRRGPGAIRAAIQKELKMMGWSKERRENAFDRLKDMLFA